MPQGRDSSCNGQIITPLCRFFSKFTLLPLQVLAQILHPRLLLLHGLKPGGQSAHLPLRILFVFLVSGFQYSEQLFIIGCLAQSPHDGGTEEQWYEIVEVNKVTPDRIDVIEDREGINELTLVTCEDANATERIIVKANLKEVKDYLEASPEILQSFNKPYKQFYE